MRQVAASGRGKPGVVLHVGDSITYSNPYGQWARGGEGRTEEDLAALRWMHLGAEDDTDGWWLARFDHPDGGRSYTASGGLRSDELLAGGKNNLPSLREMLDHYRPQIVVLMIGTNDVTAARDVAAYKADVAKALDLMIDAGVVPILSTIPPHPGRPDLARAYNEALRALAQDRNVPLIDLEREILTRRPDDWNGTLLGRDDVHLSATTGEVTPTSKPTAEYLRSSGYLLRGWLSVRKIAEVKRKVFDADHGFAVARVVHEPTGETIRVPITRDNWFSNVGAEADGNNGGSPRLKLKGHQEMSLVDIDPSPLMGRVVNGATLHVQVAGDEILHRVTVGTFGAGWVEGTASGYMPQVGSSTHNHQRHPDLPWTIPGSDLCSVIFGQGGTTWHMADALAPDEARWQSVAIEPSVLAARVAGVSEGLFLFDDTGSEWTRDGDEFQLRLFPNRYVYSREASAKQAPYLTVYLGAEDHEPPASPETIASGTGDLPPGEAWITWATPPDDGPAGTIGFFVSLNGQDVPRYLIPLAGEPGANVRMHLRDLDLEPGATVRIAVRAVDGAGNVGNATVASVLVSDHRFRSLPGSTPTVLADTGPLPRLGSIEIAVLDEMDKVSPVDGSMIPPEPEGYLASNHLWSASKRQVRLHAARNEFVAFQVLLRGTLEDVQPSLSFPDGLKAQVAFGRYHPVESKNGPLPDPIVPLDASAPTPSDIGKSRSLHVEVYVPHDAPAGDHRGTLTLRSGNQSVQLNVLLTVWDFTLPDHLSFLPEMNCYGLPSNEKDYYRLAHIHRTVLDRVPYHQSGDVTEGCAPDWNGRTLDWSAWDQRFGPYLDGSAFADLPRAGVPLELFYLPLHENWPTSMEGSYNGDYWADRAFPERYWLDFIEVSRQFAEHFNSKGWDETLFEGFLNNKNNFKARGWSRGSSPWLLDEPANFQDFWALRQFGIAFHTGFNLAPGRAKMVFRCDISRPEWQRDSLDGLLDINIVGGAVRRYRRMVLDRKQAHGEIAIEYGSTNPVEASNLQPVAWSIDAWTLGLDGILPWQTIGSDDSWKQADELSLFYPGQGGGKPVPSIRLKAYRRGQQDVEYLTLLADVLGESRWAVAPSIREALQLRGERRGTGFQGEDAGRIDYDRLRPGTFWALRTRIGSVLSEAHPAARRRLVEFRPPRRDPKKLGPGYVSVGEVPDEARQVPAGPRGAIARPASGQPDDSARRE